MRPSVGLGIYFTLGIENIGDTFITRHPHTISHYSVSVTAEVSRLYYRGWFRTHWSFRFFTTSVTRLGMRHFRLRLLSGSRRYLRLAVLVYLTLAVSFTFHLDTGIFPAKGMVHRFGGGGGRNRCRCGT